MNKRQAKKNQKFRNVCNIYLYRNNWRYLKAVRKFQHRNKFLYSDKVRVTNKLINRINEIVCNMPYSKDYVIYCNPSDKSTIPESITSTCEILENPYLPEGDLLIYEKEAMLDYIPYEIYLPEEYRYE